MKYNLVSTGSKDGNCLILNDILALDIGVPWKQVTPYSKKLQLVFASHCHKDHLNPATVRRLSIERPTIRFCGGMFIAECLINYGVHAYQIDVLEVGKRYDYGAFQIEPFPLVHDVENMGLKIWMNGERALYATDTGTMSHVEFPGAEWYFLEGNHGEAEIEARIAEKESRGEFSYERRAQRTHLSREQALDWLAKNAGPNSKYIILHQSSNNYLQEETKND